MRPLFILLEFDELEEQYTWFYELGEEIGFMKWMNGLFGLMMEKLVCRIP